MSAARLLARGWFKGSKRWWIGTGIAMGVSLALVFIVAGTLNGLESAMQERVGDFYTEDARLTPDAPGTAPGNHITWGSEGALASTLEEVDGELRMESQYLLSRRGLIQAYLTEDEQFTVGTPGGSNNDKNQYGIGVLVGHFPGDGYDGVRPYLTKGSALPSARTDAQVDHQPVEVVMSVKALSGYLTDAEERSFSTWPPTNAELRTINFEITAARLDDDSQYYDIIRYNAVPVGLYETDLDALDQFTMFTAIEEVRRLLGYDADAVVGNVITSTDLEAANAFASKRNWAVEDSDQFSKRFIGQMVEVVQSLSLLVTVLLFLVPVFLLWYGLTQQLDRQRRELAVCQALGMQEATLRNGLTLLVTRVLLLSAVVLMVSLGGYLLMFYGFIQNWEGSPFPLDYVVPWWASVSVAILMAGGTVGALWWTAKRQSRRDMVATLRAQ